jgi:hypothetical protein
MKYQEDQTISAGLPLQIAVLRFDVFPLPLLKNSPQKHAKWFLSK